MDDNIRNLMSHPNFGKAIHRNPGLQNLLKEVSAGSSYADVFNRFEFDEEGQLFNRKLKQTFPRNADEPYMSYVNRIMSSFNPGLTQIREYAGEAGDYFSGSQTGYVVGELARRANVRAKITSIKTSDLVEGSAEELDELLGKGWQGILIPRQETSNVIEFFDENDEKISTNRAFGIYGVEPTNDPSVFKRMSVLGNDREIARVADVGDSIKGFLFNPKDIFQNQPSTVRAIKEIIASGEFDHILDPEERLQNAYNVITDGISLVTEGGMRRSAEFMEGVADRLAEEIQLKVDNGSLIPGSGEFLDKTNNLNNMREEIKKIYDGIAKEQMPGGYNFRVVGGRNYLDPDDIIHTAKGDEIYVSQKRAEAFLAKMPDMQGKTPEEISRAAREIDFILPFANANQEMRSTGEASFMTLSRQPIRKEAFSNSLAMIIMGDLIDPMMPSGDRYLLHSLKSEIEDGIEAIKQGELTPGLRKVIEDYRDWIVPNDASPNEIRQAEQGKAFAKQLLAFVEAGGDLSTNPKMAQQALDIIHKHNFRKVTDKNGKPERVRFRNQERDLFTLRSPMKMSNYSHMIEASLSGSLDIEVGMASYDVDVDELTGKIRGQTTGRFRYHAADMLLARAPQGGSDADDALANSMRYDPKTRRAFYHSLRDPLDIGEFYFYDVDVRTDPNLPSEVRKLGMRRAQLKVQIPGTKNEANVPKMMKELDAINSQLHDYFSGLTIVVDGNPVNNKDIPTIDLAKRYAKDKHRIVFAQRGHEVTDRSYAAYTSWNPEVSFATSKELGGKVKYIKRLRANQAALSATDGPANPMSLFAYKGKNYADFSASVEDGGYALFKTDQVIEEAVRNAKGTGEVLTQADMIARLGSEVKSQGLLGQFVNESSVIVRFFQDYLNIDHLTASGVDEAQAKKFQQRTLAELQTLGMDTVVRESIIDATVKINSSEIAARIPKMLAENAEGIGSVIRTLQEEGRGAGINVGIDPIILQMRGSGGVLDRILAGYGSDDVADIALKEDDPLAYISGRFGATLDLEKELLDPRAKALQKEINQNLLNQIDLEATPLEATRAQEFLNRYMADVAEIRASKKPGIIDEITRSLDEGDADFSLRYSDEAAHYRSLIQLRDWGYLEDQVKLDRFLLAVAQATASGVAETDRYVPGAFNALMGGGSLDELPSITEMYMNAFERNRVSSYIDEINNIEIDASNYTKYQDLFSQYYKHDAEVDQFRYVNRGTSGNVRQENLLSALHDKAYEMRNYAEHERELTVQTKAQRAATNQSIFHLEQRMAFLNEAIIDAKDATPRNIEIPDGVGRYFARENADKAAAAVTEDNTISTSFKMMEQFNRQTLSKLMKIRETRAGIIGVGVFAGIGLLYGATKDRGFEDMQGPPLLPGGSAYEDYPQVPSNMESIYPSPDGFGQNSGMLYKVNVNGSFDANAVRDSLQAVTGSPVDTRVFNARQTLSPPQSSSEMMSGLIG